MAVLELDPPDMIGVTGECGYASVNDSASSFLRSPLVPRPQQRGGAERQRVEGGGIREAGRDVCPGASGLARREARRVPARLPAGRGIRLRELSLVRRAPCRR